jgi:hypothetical protein
MTQNMPVCPFCVGFALWFFLPLIVFLFLFSSLLFSLIDRHSFLFFSVSFLQAECVNYVDKSSHSTALHLSVISSMPKLCSRIMSHPLLTPETFNALNKKVSAFQFNHLYALRDCPLL